jgi:hypothetical protein
VGRVRLYVEQSLRISESTVIDDEGHSYQIPFLRLLGYLRVGRTARRFNECLVDTGAPISVFPHTRWQPFADEIKWLRVQTDHPEECWLTRITGWTGGQARCRVGRVAVQALDRERPSAELDYVDVIGLFEQEPSYNDRILIGLHASIFQRRRLILDPEDKAAWLEDR